jgi:hypothetical protein
VLASTIVPVPVSEKLHDGIPGAVAVPVAVIGIVVALPNCPAAEPVIVTLPAQTAEKSPAIAVGFWLVIVHWSAVHVEGSGRVGDADSDVQAPT